MKIVVTGVGGFVGVHLAVRLLELGHEVTGVSRAPHSHVELRISRLKAFPNFRICYNDLAGDISGLTERTDVVFNFAAKTFVDHSIKDPNAFIRNNYLASHNLLEDSRRNRVKRFIQMSTDEVYGPIEYGGFNEASALNPTNPYSAAKAAIDLMIMAYGATYDFPWNIVRATNIYGPWQHPQKAIPTFIRAAVENIPIPVFGDGGHVRSWLNIEDACAGLLAVAERGSLKSIYHLGGSAAIDNISLIRRIATIIPGATGKIEFIADSVARPSHDRRYALDCTRLQALGWKEESTLDEALPKVVGWYLENSHWR